jgi:cytochrome c oxidase subunit 4
MSNKSDKTGTAKAEEPHPLVGHVVPLWLLAAIGGTLIFFTWVTVAVTYVDLGRLNLWIAMFIACIKAFLVALYFMHLRWDRKINGFLFLSAIGFVTLFIGFALMDSLTYQPDILEAISASGG